jgi:hypothetical protein
VTYPETDDPDNLREDPPPEPIAVARRALILSAVVCRANLERWDNEDGRQQTAGRIRDWFDALALWPHLEPREGQIIRAEFGALPRQLGVQGTWYVEGLAILAWAVQRGPLPSHEDRVDAFEVTDSLMFLSTDAASILESPNLRSPEEITAVREWFYDLHCALRCFLRWHRDGGELANWIGQYLGTLQIDPKSVMVDGRLTYRGKVLAECDHDELEDWEPVVCERHRAAIWLRGSDEPYTQLPVDT